MSVYIEEIKRITVDSYGDVRTLVRGLPYQCPDDWKEVLDSLNEESDLYLIKEPDNPKDEMAIAAYLGDRRVGYVAADDNCLVWMFLTDEKTPCRLIQKYEASFKVAFDNPRPLFENMAFEDIYKDNEGWIEKDRPIMYVPFLRDKEDETYDWYRDVIVIRDFEEFVPDFRRKLASKMITFIARKNSQGNYRYYLPYINAGVAVVDDDMIKDFIDTDGFVIAIPNLSSKTYPGGIRVELSVARLKKENPLIKEFRAVEEKGADELVFYLNPSPAVPLDEIQEKNDQGESEFMSKGNGKWHTQMKGVSDTIEISREYFDQIDKITTELDIFVRDTLLKSRRVLRKVHKDPYYGYRFDDLKEYEIFIKIFVMKDLCHLYKELNGSVGINENEGKIFFMYTLKALSEDSNVNFDIFKEMCNPHTTIETIVKYRKLIENTIEQQYEEELPYYPKKGFLMYEVLEDENLELMDMALEYKEMMCRIASAVANAKGELTAKEIKWLSQLSKY